MHKIAHNLFAMGLSSLIFLLYIPSTISYILCMFSAYILGELPDIDFKLNITHRSSYGTHGLKFSILITIFFLIIIIGIRYLFYYFHIPIHGFIVTETNEINITENIIEWIFIFLALFTAILSHIILDMTTHSGIEIGNHYINGATLSSNPTMNFFYSIIGFFLFLFTTIYIIGIKKFQILSPIVFQIFIISIGIITCTIIFIIIKIKYNQTLSTLYCGKKNNVTLCIIDSNCINIKERMICFDDEKIK